MSMGALSKVWTLDQLHRLPDDGNKYELVHGELLVTPAPAPSHEVVLTRLHNLLFPYVAAHDLGWIFRPRAVIRFEGSEVEPDLMVRLPPTNPKLDWEHHPMPILVVECTSRATRRRDYTIKRAFYRKAGIPEYWIVDRTSSTIHTFRRDGEDVASDEMTWTPSSVAEPLRFRVADVFR